MTHHSAPGETSGRFAFKDPAMPEFQMIDTGEVRIRAAVEGTGPLVLFVHGFPESWYS